MSIKSVKKIIILALLITVLLPAVSFATHQKDCWICFENGLEWFVEAIANLLKNLSAALIAIAASFIGVIISATGNITSNPVVNAGFGIVLSVANLGFVLAIIVIAFVTILRLQNYQVKQLMFKLVVAALLINFSFAIAGVIIDFNNILGNFFLSSTGKIENIAGNLMNTLQAQKLSGVVSESSNSFNNIVGIMVPLVAVVIFNVLLVITFFALAVMLLIRYLYLLVLLILMPLAWLFSIFPNLSHLTGKWWDKFLHWNFFYPAVSFFIYLTILTSEKINEVVKLGTQNNVAVEAGTAILGVQVNTILFFLQILVQVGMIFGGLMAAQAMGIASTSAVLGAAKGTARFALGTTKLAGRSVGALGGARVAKGGAGWIANQLARPGLSWIPGAKTAAAGLGAYSSRKSEVEEYKKKYLDNLPEKGLDRTLASTPLGPVAQAAHLMKAAEMKKLEKLTPEFEEKPGMTEGEKKAVQEKRGKKLELFAQAARATNNTALIKELVDANPALAEKLTGGKTTMEEATTKGRADKAGDWSTDSLRELRVVSNASMAQFGDILRRGSEMNVKVATETLKNAIGPALTQLNEAVSTSRESLEKIKDSGTQPEIDSAKQNLRQFLNQQNIALAALDENKPEEKKQKQAYAALGRLNQVIGKLNK